MTAPPGRAPTTQTGQSHPSPESKPNRRRIRAEIAKALEASGHQVVGARLSRLVHAYTSEGFSNISEVPNWLARRGDIIQLRSKPKASDPMASWRSHT